MKGIAELLGNRDTLLTSLCVPVYVWNERIVVGIAGEHRKWLAHTYSTLVYGINAFEYLHSVQPEVQAKKYETTVGRAVGNSLQTNTLKMAVKFNQHFSATHAC